MKKASLRSRGRPRGSTTVPRDVLAAIWVQVLIARIKARARTGKTPSVRKACQEIADKGGILSAVGGNIDALAQENAARQKSWQRFQMKSDGSVAITSSAGSVFVNHTITNAGSLHARYSVANEIVTCDPRVRLAWMNLARQLLGLPAKHHVRPHLGRSWRGRI